MKEVDLGDKFTSVHVYIVPLRLSLGLSSKGVGSARTPDI